MGLCPAGRHLHPTSPERGSAQRLLECLVALWRARSCHSYLCSPRLGVPACAAPESLMGFEANRLRIFLGGWTPIGIRPAACQVLSAFRKDRVLSNRRRP